MNEAMIPVLNKLKAAAGAFAVIGAVISAVAFMKNPGIFGQCYLFGFIFWMGLTMGCFGLTMLHHMIRGKWGQPALRIWEAGNKNLRWMALFFVPVLYAIWGHHLYPWALPHEYLVNDPSLLRAVEHKGAYMQFPLFLARFVGYFVIWILISSKLNAWSLKQDETGVPDLMNKRANLSAPC